MKDDYNKERLGKIVQLAKKGVGGEKAAAVRMLKSLCKKYKLDFDEVMNEGPLKKEYYFYYKLEREIRLVQQIIVKFVFDGNSEEAMGKLGIIRSLKCFTVECTQERYIETVNAIDVLTRAYKKEMKLANEALWYGFLEKHDLYANSTGKDNDIDEEELKARRAGSAMADNMEDVQIRKRIGTPA